MTFSVIVVCLALLALVGLSAALLARPLSAEADFRAFGPGQMELLAVNHFVHCKQISRALAQDDFELVRDRLTEQSFKRVRAERREVVRLYVVELGRDFARIDRLARIVASLSPAVNRNQELNRIRLELRFRFLYRLVLLRISAGGELSADAVSRLANMVGSLAQRVETAMAWKDSPSLGPQPLGA
jgi:hypothetical protein